ncbi:MAG: 2-methylcitrate dehydratase [Nitrospiraceae bacterium]|jgi:2-methylcitrate dehydratase|nr:2-methylcitrate dehydratase [Nitrospiraceae bacterium]|tara:strand:- start:63 stop:1424 length:1362 start_codon:yes stop_codon:yes gene_type:complete
MRLAPEVVHEVKRRVLDSLGCAIGAWNAAPCRIARRLAQSAKVKNGATIMGTSHKTLPDLATFANGALIRYLDFNDTYLSKEPAHPSDNLAAILAIGETVGACGKQVIEATVLAYEIQCRLCDVAALRPRGWDHVTYGPFSSALAVAKLLGLSKARTVQAVNLAGVANIALRQTRVGDLSMWKACAFSNAGRNGVFAALLAQYGMIGPSPIFEGAKGFIQLVSGPLDLPKLGGESTNKSRLRQRMIPFKILDTYIKPRPVEYHAQTAIEATLKIRDEVLKTEGPRGLVEIAEVEIGSYGIAIEIIGRDPEKWHPETRETADHSFPYCVAIALLDGAVTLRSFESKRLRDPHVKELIHKTHVVEVDDFTDRYPQSMPTRVTVRTSSGMEYVKQVDCPLGHPKSPMADYQLEDKFLRLAARKLGSVQAGKVIDFVWKFETINDVGALMPLLRVEK